MRNAESYTRSLSPRARAALALAGRIGALVSLARVAGAQPETAPVSDAAPAPSLGPAPEMTAHEIVPPQVVAQADAPYPAAALAARSEGTVTLLVTVEVDGSVGDVTVAESAGELLDGAAVSAMKLWRFTPAQRDGQPVRAKIRVPFEFTLPAPAPARPEPSGLPSAAPTPNAAPPPLHPMEPNLVEVHGERRLRTEQRGASDFIVARDVIGAAPRREGADALATAPGVFIARGEGLAVAHRYMLRGFDAEHGQDLELRVGGLPINLPSHIHGQGYADLGFLIGEVVQEVHATEGVYDPRQGDFAVAGSIDVKLGVERRGWQARTSYGSFSTFRQVLSWAPPDLDRDTFAAVQLQHTDGFGENRRGQSASVIAQWSSGGKALRHRVLGIVHSARADLAGVVRADDIEAGRIQYYAVYPHPTARAQNALAGRALAGWFAEYRGDAGESADASVWIGFDNFRIQENSTGFSQQSQTLANVAGRGDLIEQLNRTASLGAAARYRSPLYHPAPWAHGSVELGLFGRVDDIDQAQNLIDAAVRSQTWDQRIDADVLGTDIGVFGDLDWHFTHQLALRLGMRADMLSYAIDDRLGNRVTLTRPDDTFIVGFRRSASGVAWGPRASLEVLPIEWLSVRAAYGEGFRSPQARVLDDGEAAPFSKVRSADLGVRLGHSDDLRLTLAGYYTRLSDDVAFDAEEGRLERVGATRRLGAVAYGQARPLPWLVGAGSITFVDAELLEPPPASVEEPQPPFREGQNLPFVPPLVIRADLGARPTLAETVAGRALEGRAGIGFSFLSARPLPYGEFADPVALFDATLGLGWGPLDLGVEVHNLLGERYAASELNFPSSWDPEGLRPRTPARHIAAGPPRAWLVTLGVSL